MKVPGSKKSKHSKKRSKKNFFEKSTEESFLSPQPSTPPFFNSSSIQTQLEVGAADDAFEKEADSVADQVVAKTKTPSPSPRKQTSAPSIQAKPSAPLAPSPSPIATDLNSTKGQGQAMNKSVRENMEAAFGADFQQVKIHTGDKANQLNQSLGAKAFAHGSDIYFKQGNYDPKSQSGKHLLAHELTHVVQQSGGSPSSNATLKNPISPSPKQNIQRKINNVNHMELSTFLALPELEAGSDINVKYLEAPALMTVQRQVMQRLIDRVKRAEAPLTAAELLAMVQSLESDRGTAIIICHNVTKALSRGSDFFNWKNLSRIPPDPLAYELNGATHVFDPDTFHPDAYPISSRNELSVFYAMLSIDQFGGQDEGDWYHYFAVMATSYYTASNNIRTGRSDGYIGDVVLRVADALRDPAIPSSSAYEGWLRANAISFLEGGHFGTDQGEVSRESEVHARGASAGLAPQGKIPNDGWAWKVPVQKSIGLTDLLNFRFDASRMVYDTWNQIKGEFSITVVSATTPSTLLDTPDAYVKLPGGNLLFAAAQTTVKNNTTSPVWREVITTVPHRRLSSYSLELMNSDLGPDSLIATFTHDLRPKGLKSRAVSMTSGSSTLDVEINAVGEVTIN